MRFSELPLSAAVLVEIEPHTDERGLFARSFCEAEFAAAGLPVSWPQMNTSFNKIAGTVRGMHYQLEPFEEPKLVRCTQGRVHDVIVDLRPGSATYCRHVGVDLSAQNRNALYVPPGFAHGFQTLEDNSELLYLMGTSYVAEAQAGARWDDPALDIQWPLPISSIAERDAGYPDYVADRER